MAKETMIEELLDAWEETYKKGQLTFWVFLALKEGNKCVVRISIPAEYIHEVRSMKRLPRKEQEV